MFIAKVLFSALTELYVILMPTNTILEYDLFSALTIIIYFLFFEILPLSYILYILRTTNSEMEDDYLPSALNTFIKDEFRKSDAALTFAVKIIDIIDLRSTDLIIRNGTHSLPINSSFIESLEYKTIRGLTEQFKD